jgi:hypothetical protein
MIFVLGGISLIVIQVILALVRRNETARMSRGEGPGLFADMYEADQQPGARKRLRAAWIIVGSFGLIAVIALLFNRL